MPLGEMHFKSVLVELHCFLGAKCHTLPLRLMRATTHKKTEPLYRREGTVLLFLMAFVLYRNTQRTRQVLPSPDYSHTNHVLARQHQADLRS